MHTFPIKNASVKQYIDKLPSPQKELCEKARNLILSTFPQLEETFENGVPWYECKFYIAAFRDHVNIGFSVKGLSENELRLFEGKGKFLRHIKLFSLDDFDESRIVPLLMLVK